jgi:DNA-directed RNA polymerase subunit omega
VVWVKEKEGILRKGTKETKAESAMLKNACFGQFICAFVVLFCYCIRNSNRYFTPLGSNTMEKALNAELTRKALEKVGNPNVLVNLISRRVRQLNSGAGAMSRPLVEPGNMGAADIALTEIIEEKIGFEMPEITELVRPVGKKRKKH